VDKRAWALLLGVLLPSCGGGGTAPTTPSSTTPCSQTLLFQGAAAVGAGFAAGQDFSVTSTADTRLDVIVDWTSTASAIGVYAFTKDSCTLDQFLARTCTFLLKSEPSSAKPRRVSATVAVGTYTLVIANLGTLDESVAAQIVLSDSTCAPLLGAPPGTVALPAQPLRGFIR
jgi:hypothetical protein